ncbi:hypothetical protein H5410_045451 [Solanum commersonii]|uniref:Uncharacterized protein n=1 Tax=Solanum commersonii TaxID=4109 RepID=A0A9J5X9K3_SOLCO|nr:hypothetical protein H5410_045451 [Solanum commersonii]
MSTYHTITILVGDKDFLFTVKTTSMFQWKTKLVVFLANNNSKEKNFAQMHKKITAKSLLIGKDNFRVTMYPNIDQAFIFSLIVILDAIKYSAGDKSVYFVK